MRRYWANIIIAAGAGICFSIEFGTPIGVGIYCVLISLFITFNRK
jgi:hypothetical protein